MLARAVVAVPSCEPIDNSGSVDLVLRRSGLWLSSISEKKEFDAAGEMSPRGFVGLRGCCWLSGRLKGGDSLIFTPDEESGLCDAPQFGDRSVDSMLVNK